MRASWYMFGCTRLEFSWVLHHFMDVFESFENILHFLWAEEKRKCRREKEGGDCVHEFVQPIANRVAFSGEIRFGLSDWIVWCFTEGRHAICTPNTMLAPHFRISLFVHERQKVPRSNINIVWDTWSRWGPNVGQTEEFNLPRWLLYEPEYNQNSKFSHFTFSFLSARAHECVWVDFFLHSFSPNSISFWCRTLLMHVNRSIRVLCPNLFSRRFNRLH